MADDAAVAATGTAAATATHIDPSTHLPVYRVRTELLQLIADNQIVVVTGDTGSGKSTQLAKFLDAAGYASEPGRMIAITQPRRIGAVSLAKRVAEEMGVRVGEDVGYTVRFDDCTSPATRIRYMTDGCLLRECFGDDALAKYDVIILDEAHERSLQTDMLFGVLKSLVRHRQLKLVVTSASLDVAKFSAYFYDAVTFHIPGRCHDVHVVHSERTPTYYVESAVDTVIDIHTQRNEALTPSGDVGHILVFLTGQAQIERAIAMLGARVDRLHEDGVTMPDIVILPVYAALSVAQQQRIFKRAPRNCRKVLFATNIAETSLTVDGVVYVVDAGYVKQRQYNATTGMESLTVVPISHSAALQRRGRAGRTMAGMCYRLYTETAMQNEMPQQSVPEMQRTNMANTVLTLKSIGVHNVLKFDFIDDPSSATLVSALTQLYHLGALDKDGRLTTLGTAMASFPLEPALACLLLTASTPAFACREEMLSVCAMLSVVDQLYTHGVRGNSDAKANTTTAAAAAHAQFASVFGDHVSLLCVYDSWCEAASRDKAGLGKQWCADNYLDARALRRAKDVRGQLAVLLQQHQQRRRRYADRGGGGDRGDGGNDDGVGDDGVAETDESSSSSSSSSSDKTESSHHLDEDSGGNGAFAMFDMDNAASNAIGGGDGDAAADKSRRRRHSRSRSSSRDRNRHRSRGRSRDRDRVRHGSDRRRSHSRERGRNQRRTCSRSRSRDRFSRRDHHRRRHRSRSRSGSRSRHHRKRSRERGSGEHRHHRSHDDSSNSRHTKRLRVADGGDGDGDRGRGKDHHHKQTHANTHRSDGDGDAAGQLAHDNVIVRLCMVIAATFYSHTARLHTSSSSSSSSSPRYKAYETTSSSSSSSSSSSLLSSSEEWLYLHPSSALTHAASPSKWIVYHDLLLTSKPYMRQCCVIEFEWVKQRLLRRGRLDVKRLALSSASSSSSSLSSAVFLNGNDDDDDGVDIIETVHERAKRIARRDASRKQQATAAAARQKQSESSTSAAKQRYLDRKRMKELERQLKE